MVTTFYPPYNFGGDGVFVQRLAGELVRRGHHVEVIHCTDAYRILSGGGPAEEPEQDPRIVVHGLHSAAGPLSPLATQQTGHPLFKTAQIRRVLDQDFDVIHFHNISLVGGPGVLSYGRGLKLYTMHEHWLICPAHALFRYNREVCRERRCFLCQIVHRRPPQLWRHTQLLKSMVAHVNAFIAPSRSTLEAHRRQGLPDEVPIVVLPNFVPEPPGTSLPQDGAGAVGPEPTFLFVGRLERLKGAQTLIPVFRRHRKARLLIVGSGGFEPQLREMAQGCDNIQFLGHQPAENVRRLMAQSVAVVVPSICPEVFPNVTLEAFSLGVPAIVRRIGGLPEQIEQSGGGIVFETDDELVAALDRLASEPALRDELGRRGHQAYRQRWTPVAHGDRYLALVDELSSSRPKSRGRQ